VDKGHAFIRSLVDMGILSSLDAGKIKVYGSYEDLISVADIDAVYIPLSIALHDEVNYFG
jgi:predicted dehydrogenase